MTVRRTHPAAVLTRFEAPFDVMIQGASRGIGFALCKLLLECPEVRCIVATSRTASRCLALHDLARDNDARVVNVDLDVADQRSIESGVEAVKGRVKQLRLLVNVAGLLHEGADIQPEKRLEDLEPDAALRLMQVNALGPALVTKYLFPFMPRQGRSVVANLSARVGSITDNRLGGWYAYRMSKAAQNMATRNMAIELRRRRRELICVALHPGTVATELSEPFRRRVPEERVFDTDYAARHLLRVIDGLEPDDNGKFFAWDGSVIPW